MSFQVLGSGSYLPPKVVTNQDLTGFLDTSDEWIASRTGIRERHICVTETASDLAIEAAKRALEDGKVSPKELDLILCATVSGEYICPSMACIVQAADTISAARPGARRENIENYIKRLEKLESLTNSFKGVAGSYAIQAGREIRIMVKPEEVSEDEMTILAHDIAQKIEAELEYPGQIKVNLIRETKAVEYAK